MSKKEEVVKEYDLITNREYQPNHQEISVFITILVF